MKSIIKFMFLIVTLNSSCLCAQVINAYAKITAVSGQSVLSVSNVDQTAYTFQVGGAVIVMQMQDSVISSNSNSSTFGNMGNIRNAGHAEVTQITALSPAAGTPTAITVSPPLTFTYNFGNNCSVQLITFRNMGVNFTTTGNISAKPWNGTTGGVVAMYCTGILTLNHQVSADACGFQGGQKSASAAADVSCVNTSYAVATTSLGAKGEGIFKRVATYQTYGRAHIANGGGGGCENNSGGAGGGNYSAGGNGGIGYGCNAANTGCGLGGAALSASINSSRFFMGGGGGSGQGNNNNQTAGANGGGIVIIGAATLATSGTCGSPIMVTANGGTAANPFMDGASGGGAGGTILFQVNVFSVSATCPATFAANGGNGGSVGFTPQHGGGGGGGQGAILFSAGVPTVNVTSRTLNGNPGADNSGGTVTATGGGGSNNAGVINLVTLPIKLQNFTGTVGHDAVVLSWTTATESNSKQFIIEKLMNGSTYQTIGRTDAANRSAEPRTYKFTDPYPLNGKNYYRLKQQNSDSTFDVSPAIVVDYKSAEQLAIFPNPMRQGSRLELRFNGAAPGIVRITDLYGKQVCAGSVEDIGRDSAYLTPGVYLLSFAQQYGMKSLLLIVEH